MKKHVKAFCKRGLIAAWGGPVIMAIVWLCLKTAGVVETLTVDQAVLGIISTTVMAFVAAGISIVYHIETLPKSMAALIQMAVLYIDYMGIYLLNGWLPVERIGAFTLIFIATFAVIWLIIYLSIRMKVNRINQKMQA
ncbi:MAG: DUF3021 domain-containing protein [Desulfobulbus sp.]|nr:DUF3021 domain-containing protein [Desulfobulbus sp.]